jgi:hypothetical protein
MVALMRLAVVVSALVAIAAPALAQQVTSQEAGRAQVEMMRRVSGAVREYATSIDIDPGYIDYCQTKLNEVGRASANDGSIPFGFNYGTATRQTLKMQIDTREVFERSYMILCLAEAKNTLRAAAPH